MRRDTFIEGLKNVRTALVASGFADAVSATFTGKSDSKKDRFTKDLLEAFAQLSISFSRFSDDEKRILRAFHLETLLSASVWANMLQSGSPSEMYGIYNSVGFVERYADEIVNLLSRDSDVLPLVVNDPRAKKQP